MSDPMKPSPALLCKLGSLIVHAQELASDDGDITFDKGALDALSNDAEVQKWLEQMGQLSLIPLVRAKRQIPIRRPRK